MIIKNVLNLYLIKEQTAHLVNTMLSISISLVYSQTIQHISVPQIRPFYFLNNSYLILFQLFFSVGGRGFIRFSVVFCGVDKPESLLQNIAPFD